ncbi:SRPBCC family protein [Paenibacillus roseipurpureus]|uniref:SRPBCC family protein n=1 Tax=Paenibacillus roseopurpureus TaxID=2918901 RepID=A0AA96LLN6_9BACL|nr:SRPBCC family protein [Paenibacillus sp. MBLB1832]WNR42084.1 SRPBCC family protein [Paenibacillus sp. MBLB1832]
MSQAPVARVEMLIRKPVQEVFEAFIDPAITTKFWFTKGSGRLVEGARVQWEWEMYGASAEILVKALEVNKRIVIDFGYHVEWTFAAQADNTTFVTITSTEFRGSEEEAVRQALDATEGFTIVLCGLKAYLEHGIQLNLVGDKAPYAHRQK